MNIKHDKYVLWPFVNILIAILNFSDFIVIGHVTHVTCKTQVLHNDKQFLFH